MRRLVGFWGLAGAAIWLCRRKLNRDIDCVYLWSTVQRWTRRRAFFQLLLRSLRIPWVIELNELPWTLRADRNAIESRLSPLSGAAGAVCISAFLEQWAKDWSSRRSRSIELQRVPIVVDMEESAYLESAVEEPAQVLWAASAAYLGELRLVLDAMEAVWQAEPDCRLVVTGWGEEDPRATRLLPQVRALSRPQNVILTGNLPRPQLLAMYSESTALLAPLVSTLRSEARFPTKIGEYLASGRPVVTVNVGEPGRLLTDSVTAYIADKPDASGYARAILRAVQAGGDATVVGQNGRNLAYAQFDYRCWGECLESLFRACSVNRGAASHDS